MAGGFCRFVTFLGAPVGCTGSSKIDVDRLAKAATVPVPLRRLH